MQLQITTLVLAAARLHGVVAAQTPAHLVDSIVRAEALARGVPSVGVVVVVDTLVVVQRAYGFADLSAGRVATAATPFNIASVTSPSPRRSCCTSWPKGGWRSTTELSGTCPACRSDTATSPSGSC